MSIKYDRSKTRHQRLQPETPEEDGGRLAGKTKRGVGFPYLFFPGRMKDMALQVLVEVLLAMSRMRPCHS